MGSNGLSISQSTQLSIFFSILLIFLYEFIIKLLARRHQLIILLKGDFKLLFNAAVFFTVPIRSKVGIKILNGIDIIITNGNFAFCRTIDLQFLGQCQLLYSALLISIGSSP